jgi:hypothetical protein
MRCAAPEQDHEQAELAVAQRDRAPVGRGKAPGVQVQLPAVEAVGTDAFRAPLVDLDAAAAEHRADAGEQFARAEGLGEVVVGTEFETHHSVGLLAPPGEHDDRDRRFVPEVPRQRHAVLGLEFQVEHDEVDHLLRQHPLHRAPVRDGGDAERVLLQTPGRMGCI